MVHGMSYLSRTDQTNLQAGFGDLKDACLDGVLVGAGSMVLHFSTGASVLCQCPFEVEKIGELRSGHGEAPDTSPALFGFLNHRVTDARVDKRGRATLGFDAGGSVRLVPDESGLEAYVLRTLNGVFPVH